MEISMVFIYIILLVLLIYIKPAILINFSNTMGGKLVLLVITILVAMKNTICGLLMAALLVLLLEYTYEGFKSSNKKHKNPKKQKKQNKSKPKKEEEPNI